MTAAVHIFEVYVRESATPMWLCPPCLRLRAKGKGARPPKQLDEPSGFAGRCDDCARAAQLAPGYITPTVAAVATPPDAFCPPPGWVAPKAIAPWPKPARKGRAQQQPITEEEAA